MAKFFGTDGIRGKVGIYPFTQEMTYKIGRALAAYVKAINPHKRKNQRVSIARDTRLSGDMLEEVLIKGITSCGVCVGRFGILPTPCSAYLVNELNYDLAVVISASHNDVNDNGLKFFTHKGCKLSSREEEDIESLIFQEVERPSRIIELQDNQISAKVREERGAISLYTNFLKEVIGNCNISRYKVVADCAFGAVSYILPDIAKELDINIAVLNATPDGNNINKESGSMFPNVISEQVIRQKADCGFAVDGDGDRLISCDEKGQIIDGDFILAILGKYLNNKGRLSRNTIVTTLMSNLGLEMSVSQWGGRLIKTDVGDKFVLDKMVKGKFNLGGEQSGHIILSDYSATGDGLLTALFLLKIMQEENRTLSELARCMYKFPQLLINVDVKEKRPIEQLPRLNKAIARCETKLGSKGRLYVRYSGTEDKLRIMIEGQNQAQIKELVEEVAAVAKEELGCQS